MEIVVYIETSFSNIDNTFGYIDVIEKLVLNLHKLVYDLHIIPLLFLKTFCKTFNSNKHRYHKACL